MTRREVLTMLAAAPAFASRLVRQYHLSVSPDALETDPGLLERVRSAGVSQIWIAGFFYGHWYYTPERIGKLLRQVRRAGLGAQVVSLPFGHPGDSLGAVTGQPPLTPPPHWAQCVRPDGGRHWGTSLHPPAVAENAAALRRIAGLGVRRVFFDDDFRVARGPGSIGGCFCDAHLAEFRRRHGYGPSCADELRAAIAARELSPLLRAWVDYHCDEVTGCFRTVQSAAPRTQLGVMVMYLGAEKAGLRLAAYRDVPFRVGELMFDDRSFGTVKGKTDELFSALFHRRFARPELAFSETTAFPADRLSAANLAAKLAVSTLADVRHTMFMSGLTPFARSHWATLAPAMRRQADLHSRVAGLRPRGPFQHWWGEASRYCGDDKPYSLFLAAGVPFEVSDTAPEHGWVFLADADARGFAPAGATPITRRDTPETLRDLFALKARLLPRLGAVPYIEDEKPVVCSWLPEARTVLLWNLAERTETFALRFGGTRREVTAGALELVDVKL